MHNRVALHAFNAVCKLREELLRVLIPLLHHHGTSLTNRAQSIVTANGKAKISDFNTITWQESQYWRLEYKYHLHSKQQKIKIKRSNLG